jgi:5'-nucleotidase
MDTPRTNARNFEGLVMARCSIVASRSSGAPAQARLTCRTAHAGGRCSSFDKPNDLSSCDPAQEIFEVARALPPGTVDAIVAGHTHAGIAHEVNGIPIVQSFSKGIAFGRIDLVIEGKRRRVTSHTIHPPRYLCGERREPPDVYRGEECPAGEYAGKPVVPDVELSALVARYEAGAREVRDRKLGVKADGTIRGVRSEESPLGNLFADLMRAASPGADVALTNGGGLRADLPAGEITTAISTGDAVRQPLRHRKRPAASWPRCWAQPQRLRGLLTPACGHRAVQRNQLVVSLTRDRRGQKVGPRAHPGHQRPPPAAATASG